MTKLAKKLTKRTVDDATAAEREQIIWDSEVRGFGLRVKPGGPKTFVIQYRNAQKRSVRQSLGQYPTVTADEARREAKKRLAQVELGGNPQAEREEARRAMTVSQLCELYMERVDAGNLLTRLRKPKAASTIAVDRGRITRHIVPLIGKKLAKELTPADVTKMLNDIGARKTAVSVKTEKLRGRAEVEGGPGTAKKAVGLLSAILSFGVEEGVLHANVARGVRLPKDGKRQVNDPEALHKALGRALGVAEANCETWQAIGCIKLAALTGMRAGEVTKLCWEEVDLGQKVFRLKATKTGASVRPIGETTARFLRPLRRQSDGKGFVFPAARDGNGPFGGLPNALRRIITAKALDDTDRETLDGFHLHMLRHAAATTADHLGLTLPTIAALLGHKAAGVTAGYVSKVDAVLVRAADRLSQHIGNRLNARYRSADAPADNIVALPSSQIVDPDAEPLPIQSRNLASA